MCGGRSNQQERQWQSAANSEQQEQESLRQDQRRPSNPLENASLWSKLTFQWAYKPILQQGYQRSLEEYDLPELAQIDTSQYQNNQIQTLWNDAISKQKHQQYGNHKNLLAKTLLLHYFQSTWKAQILLVVQMMSRIGQAIALGCLMQTFEQQNQMSNSNNNNSVINNGYLWAAILVVCGLLAFPSKQLQFFITYRFGMQLRVGLIASIYEQTLRLKRQQCMTIYSANDDNNDRKQNNTPAKPSSSTSSSSSTVGQVMNLVSNDVERFLTTSVATIYLIYGPLEAITIIVVGYYTVGISYVIGIMILLVVLLPLQFILSRQFVSLRSHVAKYTDQRIQCISQVIQGARVVKLNGWEILFEKRIQQLRRLEIQTIQQSTKYKAYNEAIYYIASITISIIIFVLDVYVFQDTLNPQKVFTTLTLNNILQMTMTRLIPTAIMGLSECYISCQRIQSYLLQLSSLSQCQPKQQRHQRQQKTQKDNHEDNSNVSKKIFSNNVVTGKSPVLSMENVTCYWNHVTNTSTAVPAIIDISLSLHIGHLYCIIGKVGCGKSALLLTIAGELEISKGSLSQNENSSLAYAEQESWTMNGTIRENIIMGQPFDRGWYDRIVHATGLSQDLSTLINNDLTIVGDRGVQLSGGQKARISLARALYKDADILLLDDPISAVDAKVAQHIYEYVIQDLCIKRGKCVILVTHQHRFIGDEFTCILMEDGRIKLFGSYEECTGNRSDRLIGLNEEDVQKAEPAKTNDGDRIIDDAMAKEPSKSSNLDSSATSKQTDEHNEKKTVGLIRWSTWVGYADAVGGWALIVALFGLFAITQTSLLLTIVEVGKWSESPPADQNSSRWLAIILGCIGAVVILSFLRAALSFLLLVRASNRLHHRLLHAVVRAKIEFFDCNPAGRILNRFSADTGTCDEILPLTIFDFLVGCFMALGSVITAVVVLPFVLLVMPILLWRFWKLRQIFVATTRELKRLEGISRSPYFAMLSECIDGISTIRPNGFTQYCLVKFKEYHDAHTRAFFAFVAASRWFAFKMDGLAFLLVAASSLLAVLFQRQEWFNIDPTVLGLALTMLLQLAGTNFPWMIRQSAEVVNQMISVERILDYSNAPCEALLSNPTFDNEHKDWPNEPSIWFDKFSVRYRTNLPNVLTDVSFELAPGLKIGVVGRTGSGKSSLVQSLFRLLEAKKGCIYVGGINIASLGLHKLRTNMSVIPQSPFLFSNSTIRENLDPFGKYNDSEILRVLDSVQMLEAINDNLPNGLDSILSEGGMNFSVGERQLLCMARAILVRNKILVLDEATANVDITTSRLIYESVDKDFQKSTILAVAHRLESIINYDKVLVLGQGQVLEYGKPADLLATKDGHFSTMVRTQGILQT